MYQKSNEFTWNLNSNAEFISNISHELRTPLNNILGAQQLLTSNIREISNISPSQMNFINYLGSIRYNSYRLQRIIDNFIDITDIQLGLCKLNLENEDIIHTIKTIVKYVGFIAQSKGINLLLCTNVIEKKMTFDKVKIEKVILNLLSNALKYSESNKLIIIMVIDKKESILIKVKDEGIGIPSEKLSSIFDAFVQVDKSFIRKQEGAGTGLAIAKSFVELHKGNISVCNNDDRGSEFQIELPINNLSDTNTSLIDDEDASIIHKIQIEFSDIAEVSEARLAWQRDVSRGAPPWTCFLGI